MESDTAASAGGEVHDVVSSAMEGRPAAIGATVTPAEQVGATSDLARELAALRRALEQEQAGRRAAVARYREALLATSPELPPELVTGETLDDVETAVATARRLAERVRDQFIQAGVGGGPRSVPPGSPPRRPPDLAGLSPAEKIRAGLAARAGA